MLKIAALSLALSLSAGCSEAPDPGPDASPLYEQCLDECATVDEDPLNLPNGMCPGWDPSEDTAYQLCTGECVARRPDGHYCAAP